MQWLFTLPQEDESDSWGKNAIMNTFWERYLLKIQNISSLKTFVSQ